MPLCPQIKRAAGYENVAMEANKWAKVVKMRREAEQLQFPLRDTSLQVKAVDKAEPLQMRQPLEKEVYALLQGAKLVQDKKVCIDLRDLHSSDLAFWGNM